MVQHAPLLKHKPAFKAEAAARRVSKRMRGADLGALAALADEADVRGGSDLIDIGKMSDEERLKFVFGI